MELLFDRTVGGSRCVAVASEQGDGDVHPRRVEPATLAARQRAITGRRWAMGEQVHGTELVDGDAPAWPLAGRGDIVVSTGAGRPTAVWAADCAPLALFGSGGAVATVHGGWRGLAAGIVDVALGAFARNGDEVAAAVLGPVIHPCCYAFGEAELAAVAAGVHASVDAVTATTTAGHVALDMPSAVAAALARHDVSLDVVGPCTGCDGRWFSHRVRGDRARHALVAWRHDRSDDDAAGGQAR